MSSRARHAIAFGVLLLGGLTYLARSTDPVAVAWLDRLGLKALAGTIRIARQFVYLHVHLPTWIRGSAADFAYAFSLGALLAATPRLVVVLGLTFVLGHEIAQGFELVAGTFDRGDLVVLCGGYAIAQLVFHPRGVGSPHITPLPTSGETP